MFVFSPLSLPLSHTLTHKHTHRDRPIRGSFDSEHNRLPLQTGAPAFMRVRASMHSTSGSVRTPFFLLLLLWLFQVEGKRIEATESTSTVWGRDVSELNAVNMDVLLNLYA